MLSRQIKTYSRRITVTIINKIMLSLLPTWRSLVNIYFEQRTFDVSIYIPDVALDCIASSESVNLSYDKKRCFYNYKLAIAFKDKELPGGLWCDLLGFSDRPSFKACYMSLYVNVMVTYNGECYTVH